MIWIRFLESEIAECFSQQRGTFSSQNGVTDVGLDEQYIVYFFMYYHIYLFIFSKDRYSDIDTESAISNIVCIIQE